MKTYRYSPSFDAYNLPSFIVGVGVTGLYVLSFLVLTELLPYGAIGYIPFALWFWFKCATAMDRVELIRREIYQLCRTHEELKGILKNLTFQNLPHR